MTNHTYHDRCGNTVTAGCLIQLDDGGIREVVPTDAADGTPDLGILASNPAYLARHPDADPEYYALSAIGRRNMQVVADAEAFRKHGALLITALQHGFTAADLDRITVRRIRSSVTQGEAAVCVDGQPVLNFADVIYMQCSDGSYTDGSRSIPADAAETFQNIIGGWGSIHSDAHFISAAIAHKLDSIYHYAERIRSALRK